MLFVVEIQHELTKTVEIMAKLIIFFFKEMPVRRSRALFIFIQVKFINLPAGHSSPFEHRSSSFNISFYVVPVRSSISFKGLYSYL